MIHPHERDFNQSSEGFIMSRGFSTSKGTWKMELLVKRDALLIASEGIYRISIYSYEIHIVRLE